MNSKINKKIVIAGNSGFIGQYFIQKFAALGYQILQISRNKNHINWQNEDAITNALEDAEMVINLAGKSVDCRYNEKNKAEILTSRIDTTKAIGNAILKCKNAPKLWLNSSTATIYRHEEEQYNTEEKGIIGTGFSVGIAQEWEKAFFDFNLTNTRQVALRMAIVLGKNGGALRPLVTLTKFGLGGKQGNGKQQFSWLHIEDLWQIILFIQQHKDIKGAINCVSPNAINNVGLMKTLRQKLNIPFGLPSPKWLLNIGARIIHTETELILKSRWVYPEILINNGFTFQYKTIDKALDNLLN